jgi:hypothetical protein
MDTVEAVIRSLADGREFNASVAVCSSCGGRAFHLYQVEGQDHWHVQCYECGISYCSSGKCEPEAEPEK